MSVDYGIRRRVGVLESELGLGFPAPQSARMYVASPSNYWLAGGNVASIVPLDTAGGDDWSFTNGSEPDVANHQFVAPADGVYVVTANVEAGRNSFDGATAAPWGPYIIKRTGPGAFDDGPQLAWGSYGPFQTDRQLSTVVHLGAGDKLELWAYMSTPTLSAPLSIAAPITSLPVSWPSPVPVWLSPMWTIPSDSRIAVVSGPGGMAGTHVQEWVTTADVAFGAASIPVASQTPNFAYAAGSSVTDTRLYTPGGATNYMTAARLF